MTMTTAATSVDSRDGGEPGARVATAASAQEPTINFEVKDRYLRNTDFGLASIARDPDRHPFQRVRLTATAM